MPSKLTFFSSRKRKIGNKTVTIPKSHWKGKGYYYNRGKGSGGWTKYSRSKDFKRGNKVGSGAYRQTHDRKRAPKRVKKRTKKR